MACRCRHLHGRRRVVQDVQRRRHLYRYGAFPSDTQWYVAAGDWPNNENKLSKSVFMRGDRHFPAAYSPRDVNGTFAICLGGSAASF